jgi:hypothetical protein
MQGRKQSEEEQKRRKLEGIETKSAKKIKNKADKY